MCSAQSFRIQSIMVAKTWKEYQAAGNITSVVRKKEEEEEKQRRQTERDKEVREGNAGSQISPFFLLIQSWTPPHRIMLSTFKMGQPTLVNLIWKLPYRLA